MTAPPSPASAGLFFARDFCSPHPDPAQSGRETSSLTACRVAKIVLGTGPNSERNQFPRGVPRGQNSVRDRP
jgi:hypothetical protein